jgi:hypothetical protein
LNVKGKRGELLSAPDEAHHKRDCGDSEKYKEKNLPDFNRTRGDATKTEHCGDQSNDEKYNGVMQHGSSFGLWMRLVIQ